MASVFDYIFNIGGNFTNSITGMTDATGRFTGQIEGARDRITGLASVLGSFDYAKNIAQSIADGFNQLSSAGVTLDSRSDKTPKWMKRLQIIDSTTITLFSNLLLMVMQKGLKRQWSFSGLATMVRITLMYYVDFLSLFNNPEKEWEILLSDTSGAPPEPSLFE